MKTIGLSGIMGAGKSSVIEILQEMGISVLDCDAINAQLLEKGNAGYNQVCKYFPDVLDDEANIEKWKLSQIVFQDETNRLILESIMHPLIKQEIQNQIKSLHEDIVVVEVPLLFEINWENEFDEVWCVACDEDVILKRLASGRNISAEKARERLKHQLPQAEKIRRSDIVLYNNGTKEALRKQIVNALERG